MRRTYLYRLLIALGLIGAIALSLRLLGAYPAAAMGAANIERLFAGKQQDDLAAASPGRVFPGKAADDLIVQTKHSDIWHTPAYQGYTPWGSSLPADSADEWHTPSYQGYTPSESVLPADPPGEWHTPAYQGYTPDLPMFPPEPDY